MQQPESTAVPVRRIHSAAFSDPMPSARTINASATKIHDSSNLNCFVGKREESTRCANMTGIVTLVTLTSRYCARMFALVLMELMQIRIVRIV